MSTTQGADLVAYEDGDSVVVCHPENPNAWIRSSEVVDLTDGDRKRVRQS